MGRTFIQASPIFLPGADCWTATTARASFVQRLGGPDGGRVRCATLWRAGADEHEAWLSAFVNPVACKVRPRMGTDKLLGPLRPAAAASVRRTDRGTFRRLAERSHAWGNTMTAPNGPKTLLVKDHRPGSLGIPSR